MSARASIDYLEWESDFFALSTAKLSFSDSVSLLPDESELSRFQLIQAKIPAHRLDVIDNVSSSGFRLVEGEVDFVLPIDAAVDGVLTPLFSCRSATESDVAILRGVASEVFRHSRFRTPWYQPDDSSRFYALWVEKAILGTFDHQCLILEDEKSCPLGFVTLRALNDHQARIGLLAVWPGCNGKGVGLELMKAAKHWCATQGKNRLYVATQMGNIAALRLYIRSGASINGTEYWFYR